MEHTLLFFPHQKKRIVSGHNAMPFIIQRIRSCGCALKWEVNDFGINEMETCRTLGWSTDEYHAHTRNSVYSNDKMSILSTWPVFSQLPTYSHNKTCRYSDNNFKVLWIQLWDFAFVKNYSSYIISMHSGLFPHRLSFSLIICACNMYYICVSV